MISLKFLATLTMLLLLVAVSVWAQSPAVRVSDKTGGGLSYPVARKVDQVDDYHGVKVADPYRWLEDLDSAETRAWVEAENRLTFDYLKQIPERAAIKERLTRLWNYERYGIPYKEGGRYFYTKNDGLQNQSVLYTVPALEAEPRVLLDPNKLSADGTVALSGYDITDDGKLIAYALAASGSDWNEIHVRDVETGKDLPDVVKWVKFSDLSWTTDGRGFFYSRYDEPKSGSQLAAVNEHQKLYYHKLGTPQAEDVLVYASSDEKEKGWLFSGSVTEDGRVALLQVFVVDAIL
jgi:prolyl oligopeptidase